MEKGKEDDLFLSFFSLSFVSRSRFIMWMENDKTLKESGFIFLSLSLSFPIWMKERKKERRDVEIRRK